VTLAICEVDTPIDICNGIFEVVDGVGTTTDFKVETTDIVFIRDVGPSELAVGLLHFAL
jgi:hypothetical protein